MILPTKITGMRGKEVAPDVFLIRDPSFNTTLQKWTALANVGGALCVIELRVTLYPTTECKMSVDWNSPMVDGAWEAR